MNGHANCILAVCCPPGSEAQRTALTKALMTAAKLDETAARKTAEWLVATFDFAPAGSLQVLKNEVARLAREPRTGV